MIQFRGLHGIPLAAPPSARLAEEIGLSQDLPPVWDDLTAEAMARPLSRQSLRVLHTTATLRRPVAIDVIADCLRIDAPTRQWVADRLHQLCKRGMVTRLDRGKRAALWRCTDSGHACAALDRAAIPDAAILDAVRAVNASEPEGGRRWWPVTHPAEIATPASAGSVRLFLFGTDRPRVDDPMGARLDAMAARGALRAASWCRGGVIQTLFWIDGGARHG